MAGLKRFAPTMTGVSGAPGAGAVEYHNYLSASLGGPLPREIQNFIPRSFPQGASLSNNLSHTLPPPGFLNTSELSPGCKLGWKNNKRAVFPHSFEPSPLKSLGYHCATTSNTEHSEHASAKKIVDFLLNSSNSAAITSSTDIYKFKQQLASCIEAEPCVALCWDLNA